MSDYVVTSAEAKTHLDAWLAADTAIAVGKSYTIGNRQLTRADAEEVRNQLAYWSRTYRSLQASENGAAEGGFRVATWS